MVELVTERLRLRELETGDTRAVYELYRLPETSRFESWDAFETESRARELVGFWRLQQRQSPRYQYTLGVTLKDDSRFIGLCSLECGIGTETDDPRVGYVAYRYFPDRWGKGYATEALKALVRWGFATVNLHRIHSGCVAENVASARVLEKAGLRYEGTFRGAIPIDDEWHDYWTYGLLEKDYRDEIQNCMKP